MLNAILKAIFVTGIPIFFSFSNKHSNPHAISLNDVVNVIKNDARPEVKVAAIQALQHVVEPQDKATVETVLTEAQASQDEVVKTAAAEAMTKFAA